MRPDDTTGRYDRTMRPATIHNGNRYDYSVHQEMSNQWRPWRIGRNTMAGNKPLTPTEKRLRFREVINRKSLSVMPGGFSPASARMAEMAGFDCFFLAGSQMFRIVDIK